MPSSRKEDRHCSTEDPSSTLWIKMGLAFSLCLTQGEWPSTAFLYSSDKFCQALKRIFPSGSNNKIAVLSVWIVFCNEFIASLNISSTEPALFNELLSL